MAGKPLIKLFIYKLSDAGIYLQDPKKKQFAYNCFFFLVYIL